MTKIYFASPLFSMSEQSFNEQAVEYIRENIPGAEVYLPQENESINDKSGYADSEMIANGDNKYLEEADILVAVLDGQTVDVGVAAEVGYFYSMNKPIIGLYTDSRQGTYGNQQKIDALDEIAESQFSYINLYLVGLIKMRGDIFNNVEELVDTLIKLDAEDNIMDKPRVLVVPKELGAWLEDIGTGNQSSYFNTIDALFHYWNTLICSPLGDFIAKNKKELIEVILGSREYKIEEI